MSMTAPGASKSGQILPMVACSCRVSFQGTRSCSRRVTSSYLPAIMHPCGSQHGRTRKQRGRGGGRRKGARDCKLRVRIHTYAKCVLSSQTITLNPET